MYVLGIVNVRQPMYSGAAAIIVNLWLCKALEKHVNIIIPIKLKRIESKPKLELSVRALREVLSRLVT